MHPLVETYLKFESENLPYKEFQKLAKLGETSNIERKSIRDFDDIIGNKNKSTIVSFS